VVRGEISAGETIWYVSAVFGLPCSVSRWRESWKEGWEKLPEIPAWVKERIQEN
jgi:hypothetical protein